MFQQVAASLYVADQFEAAFFIQFHGQDPLKFDERCLHGAVGFGQSLFDGVGGRLECGMLAAQGIHGPR